MTKLGNYLLGISILCLGSSAFADFSTVELQDATKVGIEEFTTLNPGHASHLFGYKTWKSEEDAKIIIYVDHGGMAMEFEFQCHKHEGNIECHEQ